MLHISYTILWYILLLKKAAIELNKTDFSQNILAHELCYEEVMLCCIRFFPKTDLFEISPRFSPISDYSTDIYDIRNKENELVQIYTFHSKSGSLYG